MDLKSPGSDHPLADAPGAEARPLQSPLLNHWPASDPPGGSAGPPPGDGRSQYVLDPGQDCRRREITRLALLLLGAPGAARFLATPSADLGASPLDLAIASPEGRDRVEAELGRLISCPSC